MCEDGRVGRRPLSRRRLRSGWPGPLLKCPLQTAPSAPPARFPPFLFPFSSARCQVAHARTASGGGRLQGAAAAHAVLTLRHTNAASPLPQVHHIDTAVVMLVDIMAPGAAPISSPLPLAVALPDAAPAVGQPDSGPSEAPGTAGQEASPARHVAPEPAARQLPVSTSGGRTPAALPAAPAVAYALHYPAWLVDGSAGLVYRLQLDLRAVADSQASDAPRLLAFLQRRRASGAARRDAAGITLRVLRGLVQDEAPLPLLRSCFDIVNSFAEAAARPQQPDSGAASGASSAASSGRASPLPAGVRPASPSPALVAAAHQQQPVVTPEVRARWLARWAAAPPLTLRCCSAVAARRSSPTLPRHATSHPQCPPAPCAQDVHHSVFALLRAQGAAAPAQLRAGLCEYLGSRHARGLGAAPCLAALYVDCLLEEVS